MGPLKITHVRVRKGAIDFDVRTQLPFLHVTEEQAARILWLMPNLANHVCVNDTEGESLGPELVGTELPHLFEHIIIELQGKAASGSAVFTGHTSWLDELDETGPDGYALMRTTVTFRNDFVALTAAGQALEIIRWMVDPAEAPEPDVAALIFQLEAF